MELLYEIAQTPTEGKLFEVKPLEIDRSKFEKSMKDQQQEWTRQIIQEAFAEVEKYPEKYTSTFYTLIPEKIWNGCKTFEGLIQYANDCGGEMADWVEQALEWAQRIINGESWEAICNNADTANWLRLVVWENGYCRLVGDRWSSRYTYSATNLGYICDSQAKLFYTVPLVVIRK